VRSQKIKVKNNHLGDLVKEDIQTRQGNEWTITREILNRGKRRMEETVTKSPSDCTIINAAYKLNSFLFL